MKPAVAEPEAALPIKPDLGLLAILVCTPLAVVLVPENVRPAGALRASGLVMTLGLLVSPAVSVLKSPVAVFRVEHLTMFGLTYWILLDLLQGAYDLEDVSRSAVRGAIAAIGVFAFGVWVAASFKPWRLPATVDRIARTDFSTGALFSAILVCAALCAFRFAWPCRFDVALMFRSLAKDRWSAPWARSSLGGWGSFIDHLQYFGYLLPTLTVLLAYRVRSWHNPLVVLSGIISLTLTMFLAQGGSRRIVGVMFGSALICWTLRRGRTLRLESFLLPALGAAALLVAMQLILTFRGVGYASMFDGKAEVTRRSHLHVDDNFLRLSQIIDIIPDRHAFVYHKVFVWVLIRPIPRAIWKDKPVDPGFDLTSAVGKKGVALTSSVIGELFLSFGWPAVLAGGWFFGRLAGMCNQFLNAGTSPMRLLMYATSSMALFTGVRSMIELVLMSYMLVAWYLIVSLTQPAETGPA